MLLFFVVLIQKRLNNVIYTMKFLSICLSYLCYKIIYPILQCVGGLTYVKHSELEKYL